MKMSVGTMAALVLVAVAVSALVINFGIVEAKKNDVKASIEAELKLEEKKNKVVVKVEAEGLASKADFTVRPYIASNTNCIAGAGQALAAFNGMSDKKGKLTIKGTISGADVDDVGSVSIRSSGGPGANPPVVCFQDTTP